MAPFPFKENSAGHCGPWKSAHDEALRPHGGRHHARWYRAYRDLIQALTITPDSTAEDEGCNQLSLFDR